METGIAITQVRLLNAGVKTVNTTQLVLHCQDQSCRKLNFCSIFVIK